MRESIKKSMGNFRVANGETITIETKVYRDFSTAYPENFTDANGNGKYDAGESFIDRNANGKWDPAIQIGGTMGGPGDVVSYTAVFPKKMLFGSLTTWFGVAPSATLRASTIVRNEAFVRKSS